MGQSPPLLLVLPCLPFLPMLYGLHRVTYCLIDCLGTGVLVLFLLSALLLQVFECQSYALYAPCACSIPYLISSSGLPRVADICLRQSPSFLTQKVSSLKGGSVLHVQRIKLILTYDDVYRNMRPCTQSMLIRRLDLHTCLLLCSSLFTHR